MKCRKKKLCCQATKRKKYNNSTAAFLMKIFSVHFCLLIMISYVAIIRDIGETPIWLDV